MYRAYRGFFVLLPAIFRRVYAKLETTVGADLALESEDVNENSARLSSWKTKGTVSVLATVVTFSYFVGGFVRILTKFFGTIGKTSSLPESFGAAAREAIDHENRIRRRMSLEETGNGAPDTESNPKTDGLSP